jgi:hypothetical protein
MSVPVFLPLSNSGTTIYKHGGQSVEIQSRGRYITHLALQFSKCQWYSGADDSPYCTYARILVINIYMLARFSHDRVEFVTRPRLGVEITIPSGVPPKSHRLVSRKNPKRHPQIRQRCETRSVKVGVLLGAETTTTTTRNRSG